MPTGDQIAVTMMTEGGTTRITPDSLQGQVGRPVAQGWAGGKIATLETLFDFFINNVPDPDTALAQDPNFDEKMRQQPDVHAAMSKREKTVATMPVRVKASTAKGGDLDDMQAMADYATEVLSSIPNKIKLYEHMQSAVLLGGCGVEFSWQQDALGVARPVDWTPLHKGRFVFDRLGNMAILTRQYPVWGAYVCPNPVKMTSGEMAFICPPGKFMYHKYKASGGPFSRPAEQGYEYWGRGEDTNLYLIVTFDQFVTRFRLKWLEKHGMPLSVLYYPDNLATAGDITAICESIRGETVVRIPRGTGPTGKESSYSLDFVQPPSIGHDAFASFTETYTRPSVDKILLGGANAMMMQDEGGYNASLDQADRGEAVVFRYDGMNIDETMDRQLIWPIVRQVKQWRDAPDSHMPKHCITPERDRNRLQNLEIIEKAGTMVPVREDDVYDAAGLERPKDGADGGEPDRTVFLGQPMMDPFTGFPTPAGEVAGEEETAGAKARKMLQRGGSGGQRRAKQSSTEPDRGKNKSGKLESLKAKKSGDK